MRRKSHETFLRPKDDVIALETVKQMRECPIHRAEPIKYYCKDCQMGLCPECIVHHARHDFVFADEEAANQVKGKLETLHRSVKERHESYGDLFRKAEDELRDLEKLQDEEVDRISKTFKELRQAIDEKEQYFK